MKWIKWLYPGLNLKRWLFLFGLGTVLSCVGVTLIFNYQFVGLIEALVFNFISYVGGEFYQSTITALGLFNVVVGIFFMCYGGARVVKTVIRSVMPGEKESLRELIFTQQKLDKGPSVVVIGGGTGLSVLLRGIKLITNNCTAVVTTADDGGSSGRLRKEMGIIPPGDMRNCLVALADTEPVMERAMQYRFHDSEFLSGHSLGNLFIAAMSDLEGNMEDGLAAISEILKVHGRVWPSTSENIQLKAQMDDGSVVIGESAITASPHKIVRLMTEPENPKASQRAVDAILHADAALLTRALENVLQNAVRHNAGPITLAFHVDADETTLHLTIQDDGTGYPQSVLAVLNGEPEGENAPHILGLHVVEQIINAHGGSVQFVNRDPHGAKVMMQLPLAKDENEK